VPEPAWASRRQQRAFRIIAVLGVPLLCLGMFEFLLRLLGSGYQTAFFVRHPAVTSSQRVENQRFAWRFAPRTLARHPDPALLTTDKPPGTCRVFVFGESAAMGDPAPAFAFWRILEVLLRDRYPDRRFEVINTAFTAINSHVILPIARDCQALEGDFWLVYMGNNEVIGPYGTGTVFGKQAPPQGLIRASLAAKATRLGQCLDALLQTVGRSRGAAQGWGGMSMFLDQHVRLDDPRMATLDRHFRDNLNDLIELGTEAGATVVVSTIVSRLRDWPPFGSMHRANLTAVEKAQWDTHHQAGLAAQTSGDLESALGHFEAAAAIDPTHAGLQYRWGTCALALERAAEARTHLTLARDHDTLRFRTDSRLNEAIRQTTGCHAGSKVRLIDAERAFAHQSPHGLPGEEFLYEHVHFTFAGNYALARLFAEELASLLPPAPAPAAQPARPWLTIEACAARLGYTESHTYEIAKVVRQRLDEPIYRQQADHAEHVARVDRQLADLRGHAKPTARRRAVEACRQAAAAKPDDWMLHQLAARLLTALDDPTGAVAEWREVARLIPHSARPYTEIGKLQQARNQDADAKASFTKALELDPDSADAHVGLGQLSHKSGNPSAARRHYRRALDLDPTKTEAAEGLKQLAAVP